MALSDVYQLTQIQSYQTEEIINTWFFEKIDPAGTAADLAQAFVDTYLDPIRQIQALGLHQDSLRVVNLGDVTDFAELPTDVGGLAGNGDTMPAFVAVGFSLRPNTRAIRPGSKRFCGILEAVITTGVITEPTYVDNVEALRIVLDDNAVGDLAEYQPVIVKRVKYDVPGSDPVRTAYRLPENDGELSLGLVVQAFTNLRVTSQVSRKF
jgi:hypothetical protein